MNEWIKSSRRNLANCAEVERQENGDVRLRDSKTGKWLYFYATEWADFTAGVKNGEFDVPEPV